MKVEDMKIVVITVLSSKHDQEVNFLAFSCRGLNNPVERRELFSWLKDQM